MNFDLTSDQKHWRDKAREFAMEEIRPIAMQRDRIEAPRDTWDWDIIKRGSALGFRTLAVPKDWAGPAPIS